MGEPAHPRATAPGSLCSPPQTAPLIPRATRLHHSPPPTHPRHLSVHRQRLSQPHGPTPGSLRCSGASRASLRDRHTPASQAIAWCTQDEGLCIREMLGAQLAAKMFKGQQNLTAAQRGPSHPRLKQPSSFPGCKELPGLQGVTPSSRGTVPGLWGLSRNPATCLDLNQEPSTAWLPGSPAPALPAAASHLHALPTSVSRIATSQLEG